MNSLLPLVGAGFVAVTPDHDGGMQRLPLVGALISGRVIEPVVFDERRQRLTFVYPDAIIEREEVS